MIRSGRRPKWLRTSRRERGVDLLFILPTIAILAGFLVYPLVYGIVLSVHDTKGFELTTFVGLEHYARAILGDAVFHREPGEHPAVHWRGRRPADRPRTPPGRARRRRTTGTGVLPSSCSSLPFVHRTRSRSARSGSSCYAPVLRDRADRGCGPRARHATFAPLADADTALWAIMAAFLWRFAGFSMVVYLAAIRALPPEYYESRGPRGCRQVPAVPARSRGRCCGRRPSPWCC